MLIGGASLYEQIMTRVNNMYITQVHHTFEGDTWFPEFDLAEWKIESQQDFSAEGNNKYAYSFVKYVRES